MGHKGVPKTSSISQWQTERIRGCGPLIWLWDAGIQWIGGILHSSMSMVEILVLESVTRFSLHND